MEMWTRWFALRLMRGSYSAFFRHEDNEYSSGEEDGREMLQLVEQ